MRALVVCYERLLLQQVARLLSEWGFEVTKCEHGGLAMELFEEGEAFELMIAQLMLPWKDGWELSKWRTENDQGLSILLTHQWSLNLDFEQFAPTLLSPLPVDPHHLEQTIRGTMFQTESYMP